MRKKNRFDVILLLAVLLLSLYGTLMIYSAGAPYAKARYGDEYYFIKRQIIWLVLGLAAMLGISRIPADSIRRATPYLCGITVALLITVLFIGFVGNGAKRWISIGPFTLQPSEIAKICLILALASYYSSEKYLALHSSKKIFLGDTAIPAIIMLIPIILVMLQKHLSCVIILSCIGLVMIIISGSRLKYIYGFGALGGAAISALAIFTDYTKERITVWRDPEKYKLTGGWQTLQGLMAIGSGGVFGVGFGKSVMKHCYVSEPANDMIFSILCEELGLIGALAALLLFFVLIWRGIMIGLHSNDRFSALCAIGISAKCAIQALLNVAVVTNSIPNTGISLPFFSYGGSSLIMIFAEMGILLSISRYSEAE